VIASMRSSAIRSMQLSVVLVASMCLAQRQSTPKRMTDRPPSSATSDSNPSAASKPVLETTPDARAAPATSDSGERASAEASSTGSWVTPYPSTSAPPLVAAEAPTATEAARDLGSTPVLIKSERPIRVGLLVGIISIPRPVSFELFVKVHNLIGIGVGYNLLPSALGDWLLSIGGVHNASVESSAWDVDLRVFVLRGSFFVGTSLGHQSVSASYTANLQQYGNLPLTGDLSSFYLTPRLGWLWIWSSGFSMGVDAGVQIPIAHDLTLPAVLLTVRPDQSPRKEIEDAAKIVGETPLPSINFRLGYTF